MAKIKTISATIFLLCLGGLAISVYLYRLDLRVDAQSQNASQQTTPQATQTFQGLEAAPCDINAIISCSTVAKSEYSEIADIKIALLGMVGYVVLMALLAAFLFYRKRIILYLFLLTAFFGVAFSTYLTYLEAVVIEAFCPWCIVSYVLMIAIFGLGIYLVLYYRKLTQTVMA